MTLLLISVIKCGIYLVLLFCLVASVYTVTNTAIFMNYLEIIWTQERLHSTKWMQCNLGPSQFKNWFSPFC